MPRYAVNTAAESLTATVAKSILAIIAGATRRFKVFYAALSGSSITATDAPIFVELCTSSQAGAGTSTGVTPGKLDPGEPSSICTAARSFSAEPTVLTALDTWRFSPIGNSFFQELPLSREWLFAISTSAVLRVTAPQSQSNFSATLKFEE